MGFVEWEQNIETQRFVPVLTTFKLSRFQFNFCTVIIASAFMNILLFILQQFSLIQSSEFRSSILKEVSYNKEVRDQSLCHSNKKTVCYV